MMASPIGPQDAAAQLTAFKSYVQLIADATPGSKSYFILVHVLLLYFLSEVVEMRLVLDIRSWNQIIGPILDDRLKEKLLRPWKCAHSSRYVSVCLRATGHTF